jgi:hypothetical protein
MESVPGAALREFETGIVSTTTSLRSGFRLVPARRASPFLVAPEGAEPIAEGLAGFVSNFVEAVGVWALAEVAQLIAAIESAAIKAGDKRILFTVFRTSSHLCTRQTLHHDIKKQS